MKLLFSQLHKEFLLLGRAINGILSVLVLITSIVFIFNYALEQTGKLDRQTLIGIKWSVLFLTSYVFIGQSAWEERESGGGRIGSLFIPTWMRFLSKSFAVFSGLTIAAVYLMILLSVFFLGFPFGLERPNRQFDFSFARRSLYFFFGSRSESYQRFVQTERNSATAFDDSVYDSGFTFRNGGGEKVGTATRFRSDSGTFHPTFVLCFLRGDRNFTFGTFR